MSAYIYIECFLLKFKKRLFIIFWHIARIRLQQAATLLKTTQLRVEDVSEAVGYKNPETLIRAFRRAYGKTPSQYRREA